MSTIPTSSNSSSGQSWRLTRLWALIDSKTDTESRNVAADVTQPLRKAEQTLKSAGTMPLRFTLHDEQHAFRVANRMIEIIPDISLDKLSSYELGLLLMSAYMHDIGMSPSQDRIQLHEQFLESPDGSQVALSLSDRNAFTDWLNAHAWRTHSDSRSDTLSYYIRYRHNDWSEEWIRDNLVDLPLGHYVNWLLDLVLLCRSHHEDYAYLASNRFDIRIIPGSASLVNLRYLAAVLRISDILEFDPERTPRIIYHHRAIPESSKIYWMKDSQASLRIRADKSLVLHARPTEAIIQKALETTADQIDHELHVCRLLSENPGFDRYKGEALPHRWDLPTSLERDISAYPGTYEYIKGEFRPDTPRLLKLLAGTDLYGKPEAAIRELLQNAFDAVSLAIALAVLDSGDSEHSYVREFLATRHQVKLSIETTGEEFFIHCADSGAGMSKSVIESDFLVAASGPRSDVRSVMQRCKNAGFQLERTGQFGIGVLSYFMLADELVMTTRPYGAEAWKFTTTGVGDFGELRKAESESFGTTVRLRLKQGILGNTAQAIWDSISAYLDTVLVRIPCRLVFAGHDHQRIFEKGWIRGNAAKSGMLEEQLFEHFRERTTPSGAVAKPFDERTIVTDAVAEKMKSAVRFCIKEIDVRQSARVRISIPVYQLPDGYSLGFLDCVSGNARQLNSLGNGYIFFAPTLLHSSWNGFGAVVEDFEYNDAGPAIIEIDWYSQRAVSINASRNNLILQDFAKTVLRDIIRSAAVFRGEILQALADCPYKLLNCVIHGACKPLGACNCLEGQLYWPQRRENLTLELMPIEPPIVVGPYACNNGQMSVCGSAEIPVLLSFNRTATGRLIKETFSPPAPLLCPIRLAVATVDERYRVFVICDNTRQRISTPWGATCEFPPEWRGLCGVQVNLDRHLKFREDSIAQSWVWNQGNPIVEAVDEAAWIWSGEIFEESVSYIVGSLVHARKSRSRTAAWLLRCLLAAEGSTVWCACLDQEGLTTEIWELLGLGSQQVMVWLGEYHDEYIRGLSATGLVSGRDVNVKAVLAEPHSEWALKMKIDRPDEDKRSFLK